MSSIFNIPKDSVPHELTCGVVYKIGCNDCEKVYIGQTKNSLKTRVGQHRAALRLCQPAKSAVAEHIIIMSGHQINWQGASIIARESNWRKRLFLESWMTEKHGKTCLNRSDLSVPAVYRSISESNSAVNR